MKMKKTLVKFIAVIIICSETLYAQQGPVKRMMAPPSGETKIVSPDGTAFFPFELISNHIILPVEINGVKVKLILDTGMPFDGVVLYGSQTTDKLNLSFIGKAHVKGSADGSAIMADVAMGVNFKLPGVEFSSQMVTVMPNDGSAKIRRENVDGVIGNSIFSHYVVSIDYDNMKITLMDPEKFDYSGKGEKILLEFDLFPMTKCIVEMENGKKIPLKLTVDTGNSLQLALNISSTEAIVLPENHIKTYGYGVGKEFSIKTGRIKSFNIGSYRFSDVVCNFNADKKNDKEVHGNLGQSILKRFNVIFDYAHKTMILEPNSKFNEPFEFDMAGFQFVRTENNLIKITHVIRDSPAAEAGLKKGSLLETINGKPVERLTKDEVTSILEQEGKEVVLEIKRDEENITERIVLRRLI